jgi:hypothetical protein
LAAVLGIEDTYLDAGKRQAAFSSSGPLPLPVRCIVTGVQLSLTVALLLTIATEVVGAKTGLGNLIWRSWQVFAVEEMYCGFITCAALGFAFQFAGRRYQPRPASPENALTVAPPRSYAVPSRAGFAGSGRR